MVDIGTEAGGTRSKVRNILAIAVMLACLTVIVMFFWVIIAGFNRTMAELKQPATIPVRIDGIERVVMYDPYRIMVFSQKGDRLEAAMLQTTSIDGGPTPKIVIATDVPAGTPDHLEAMACPKSCAGIADAYGQVILHLHDAGEIDGAARARSRP